MQQIFRRRAELAGRTCPPLVPLGLGLRGIRLLRFDLRKPRHLAHPKRPPVLFPYKHIRLATLYTVTQTLSTNEHSV